MRFRGGPVNLFGEYDAGEDRTLEKLELIIGSFVNGDTEDVGWQNITGKLDAVELAVERLCKDVGEGGFTNARHVFDQNVALRKESGHNRVYGVAFPV